MSAKSKLTYERAAELLDYNPETGTLTWKRERPGCVQGALVGTRTGQGYSQIEIDYRLYKAHRVIWLLQTGEWPHFQIDHINGMRADNRWKNLRHATPLQNSRNRRAGANSKSGVVGVSWSEQSKRWHAYIGLNNRTVQLGRHEKLEDAVAARHAAEREHYGEFAPSRSNEGGAS
jgi:hypothetical protein